MTMLLLFSESWFNHQLARFGMRTATSTEGYDVPAGTVKVRNSAKLRRLCMLFKVFQHNLFIQYRRCFGDGDYDDDRDGLFRGMFISYMFVFSTEMTFSPTQPFPKAGGFRFSVRGIFSQRCEMGLAKSDPKHARSAKLVISTWPWRNGSC